MSDLNQLIEQVARNQADFLETQKGHNTEVAKAFSQLQEQVDAIDRKTQSVSAGWHSKGGDPVAMLCKSIADGKADLERNGRLRFETKTLLSTGLTTPAAMDAIGASGRAAYGAVRNSMRTVPITSASVFRVRESSNTLQSSPQTEGSTKNESTVTLTGETVDVRTIATFIDVSKQALDDVEGLGEFLRASLLWANEKEVEEQLVSGDGTGQNLTGLATSAQAFDSTILPVANGYEFPDVLAAAGIQLIEDGFMPTHYVVSPRDWFLMETLKDDEGRYILGYPREAFQTALWGKQVIPSPAITQGTFLAYDASQNIIRQRQMATVDVSFEHASHFTANLACIRLEERLLLVTMHGDSAVYGSLTTSPA